ncbi:MAG: glutamate-5-semialdehyde dehydrogenase [Chryseolinea sp.]
MDFDKGIFRAVKSSGRALQRMPEDKINELLLRLADETVLQTTGILQANRLDLERMDENDPKYDRLKLTPQRLQDIAHDIRKVAALPTPLRIILEKKMLDNGLALEKITVPLGVIGIIYEARPNVTLDVFALCFKSGNACILKGGSDAENSNKAIVAVIRSVLEEFEIDPNVVVLLPSDRAATLALLEAVGEVDVIIPRGSQQLIDYVRNNAKVPVIETGAGIVHAYFDESGDVEKGAAIIFNSKTRRVSVCNALDCLIIHQARLADLGALTSQLAAKNVRIYADEAAFDVLHSRYPDELLEKAKEEHFGIEFLDFKLSIRTVKDMSQALDHIYTHSSRHSEVIIAEDEESVDLFLNTVDAAAVYSNASTAFTDGAQFGMGAEIGISTQKLHARGPMALREMTSYKWIIKGNGTVRIP